MVGVISASRRRIWSANQWGQRDELVATGGKEDGIRK
jgi:hypothetical protein